MARSAECSCSPQMTCGYCLSTRKPYHFTTAAGSVFMVLPDAVKREAK